jgi:hypothetical protein
MLSPFWVLLSFAGIIFSLISPTPNRNFRIILLLISLPSLLFMGKIENFMMSRYMMIVCVPIFVVFLTLCCWYLNSIVRARFNFKIIPYLLIGLVAALQLYGKTHLITTVENKGMLNFIRPFANHIKEANGIVLSEYPRISAPFEHIFGIPSLGIDNEMQNDYTLPLQEWAKIMSNDCSKKAFFLTPFQQPVHPYFVFKPITNAIFRTKRLISAFNTFPHNVGEAQIHLKLFEMLIASNGLQEVFSPPTNHPMRLYSASMEIGAGNLSLSNFANLRNDRWEVYGVNVGSNEDIVLTAEVVKKFESIVPERVDIVVFSFLGVPPLPLECNGSKSAPPVHLAGNWYFYPLPGGIIKETQKIKTRTPLLFTQLLIHKGSDTTISILPDGGELKKAKELLPARWARARSAIALPSYALMQEPELWVFCYASPLPAEQENSLSSEIEPLTSSQQSAVLIPERWQWVVIKFSDIKVENINQAAYWAKINTACGWNPEKANFPDDLGVLMAYPVVVFRR